MNLQALKLFNFGVKSKPSSSQCGFTENAVWLVEGSTKLNQRGQYRTSDVAQWWNTFILEHVEEGNSLIDLLNQGLKEIKESPLGETHLGVSIAIVRDIGEELELFLIGNCEVMLGTDAKLVTALKEEHNWNLTQQLVMEMQDYIKEFGVTYWQTRELIAKRLYALIIGGMLKESYHLVRSNDASICKEIVQYQKIKKAEIQHICLINSGVMQYYQVFKEGTEEDLYKLITSQKYLQLYDILQDRQENDDECMSYPRLKPRRCLAMLSVLV